MLFKRMGDFGKISDITKFRNKDEQTEVLIMKNKAMSTFDRVMANPKQKGLFDKEYSSFLLSEFLLEAMESRKIPTRKLAKINSLLTPLDYELIAKKAFMPVH